MGVPRPRVRCAAVSHRGRQPGLPGTRQGELSFFLWQRHPDSLTLFLDFCFQRASQSALPPRLMWLVLTTGVQGSHHGLKCLPPKTHVLKSSPVRCLRTRPSLETGPLQMKSAETRPQQRGAGPWSDMTGVLIKRGALGTDRPEGEGPDPGLLAPRL